MARFAKINVGTGKPFDASKLSPEMRTAIEQGMTDAWAEFAELQKRIDAKEVTSGEMFGTREYLNNNYLYRIIDCQSHQVIEVNHIRFAGEFATPC